MVYLHFLFSLVGVLRYVSVRMVTVILGAGGVLWMLLGSASGNGNKTHPHFYNLLSIHWILE
jgi:hypothetical protein